MSRWLELNWSEMFVPSQPLLETVIRGTATYLSLFVLLRIFRRQTGSIGTADLLVLLLIADAAQNAMAHEYRSVTEGIVLVSTIIFWEFAIDWLSYHFPVIASWCQPKPLCLVRNGQVDHANLQSMLMTMDELLSQIRQHGIDSLAEVDHSRIEPDGHISVIPKSPDAGSAVDAPTGQDRVGH